MVRPPPRTRLGHWESTQLAEKLGIDRSPGSGAWRLPDSPGRRPRKGRGAARCRQAAGVPHLRRGRECPGLLAARCANGAWRGFDVDICRALPPRSSAMQQRSISSRSIRWRIFSRPATSIWCLRGLTQTFGREVSGALRFGPIVLYDGQGFLVPKKARHRKSRRAVGQEHLRIDGCRLPYRSAQLFPPAQSHAESGGEDAARRGGRRLSSPASARR